MQVLLFPISEKIAKICEFSNQSHEVCLPFFWLECKNELDTNEFFYDLEKKEFVKNPIIFKNVDPSINQPSVTGLKQA